MHHQKLAYRPQFSAFRSDDAITIDIGIDKWTHKSIERLPVNSEVFNQSLESAARFELWFVRADGSKALLKIPRWPVCFLVSCPGTKQDKCKRPTYVMAGLVPAIHENAPVSPSATRCPDTRKQVRA